VDKWSPESFRAAYRPVDEAKFKAIHYGGPDVERQRARLEAREIYYGCVAQLDSAIGDLSKLLKERDLFKQSFIYFSSDNGPEHRAVHSWGTPGAFRGAKGHLHEGGIRTPGFAVWPGHIQPSQRSDTPIHAWDAFPTFAELAGVKPALKLDGVSFLPATRGEPLERRIPLYWSWYNARGGVNYVMREGDWKICGIAEPRPSNRTVVEHIKQGGFSGFELFNLKNDPNEDHDLAKSRPEVLERLKAKLLPLHREITAEGPILRMDGDPLPDAAALGAKSKKGRKKK
jgi:arylsulfatase A-like enzyme